MIQRSTVLLAVATVLGQIGRSAAALTIPNKAIQVFREEGLGESLAMDRGKLIAGAPTEQAVYIYERNNNHDHDDTAANEWSLASKLNFDSSLPLFEGNNNSFGKAVAIRGNLALVGAPDLAVEGESINPDGAAYIFVRDSSTGTWKFSNVLTTPETVRPGDFGTSLAIGDGVFFVGEVGAGNSTHANIGAVHAYSYTISNNGRLGNLQHEQTIFSPYSTRTLFGTAVATAGTTLVVGESGAGERRAGLVHVYQLRGGGTYTLSRTLEPTVPETFLRFGSSVGISKDETVVVVGAQGNPPFTLSPRTGKAYIFSLSSSDPQGQELVTSTELEPKDEFGHSVVLLQNKNVFVGAPGWRIGGRIFEFSSQGVYLGGLNDERDMSGFGAVLAYSEYDRILAVTDDFFGPTNDVYLFSVSET